MQSRFKREKSRRDANESVCKADFPQPAVTCRVRPATSHLGIRTVRATSRPDACTGATDESEPRRRADIVSGLEP